MKSSSTTSASIPVLLALWIMSAPIPAWGQKATFSNGKSSTGWIHFEFQDRKRIFVPAKINGHETQFLLATGLPIPDIDKTYAANIGLPLHEQSNAQGAGSKGAAPSVSGLKIQIGNLTIEDSNASVVDFEPLSKHIGHSLPFLLGDDAFSNLTVDIDFAHQRIAFRNPSESTKPPGAVEVPLTKADNEHLVPVSIEGAAPAEFELGLGNSGDLLVYESYYQANKLLEGRRVSKRLAAGTGGFIPEIIACLGKITFAGVTFTNAPAAFIPASQTGTLSNTISGDLGLPVLTRFHLIIDYPHDRLYAIPYSNAQQMPLAKDRLGLTLSKDDATFSVRFVAPNSPAETAGFKVGDKITQIDGKPAQAWAETAVSDLRYGARGTTLRFNTEDGNARRVMLTDYF